MSRAELPQNLHQAADEIIRQQAGIQETGVMQLSELEQLFAAPESTAQAATQAPRAETINSTPYNEMSKIQQLKALSNLDLAVRQNPDLKQYLDKTFPDGYAYADPALRLYTWDSFKSEQAESEISLADQKVLDAQRYQMRQLDIRKINAGKVIWAEKASAELVLDLEAKMKEDVIQAEIAAYQENELVEAQYRAKIVSQRAAKDVQTFLEIDVFVKACESAGYSIADITSDKPEYAVITLRNLLNEWQKNGTVEQKPEKFEAMSGTIALSTLRKVLRDQKTKTARPNLPDTLVELTSQGIELTAEHPIPEPAKSLSAGARAYEAFPNPAQINAVTLTAVGGQVVRTFPIDHPAGAR